MLRLSPGDAIPLNYQAADYDAGLFVKAFVQKEDGSSLLGSPVILTANDASGLYLNRTLLMPNSAWVLAKYAVYTDNTYTVLSSSEGGSVDVFSLDTGGGGEVLPPTSNIVGIIEANSCPALLPIEETIVKGSDRTITVRLVQNTPTGLPFSLADASLLEFRFYNADGSILSLLSTDLGAPVQVVSAALGQLLCVLTAAQTALLAARTPSPFTIIVTQSSGLTVINLPTQLAVVDQDV